MSTKMRYEMDSVSALWSRKTLEKLKLKGCGMINCRSRLSNGNSVRDEIQQIAGCESYDGINVAKFPGQCEDETE